EVAFSSFQVLPRSESNPGMSRSRNALSSFSQSGSVNSNIKKTSVRDPGPKLTGLKLRVPLNSRAGDGRRAKSNSQHGQHQWPPLAPSVGLAAVDIGEAIPLGLIRRARSFPKPVSTFRDHAPATVDKGAPLAQIAPTRHTSPFQHRWIARPPTSGRAGDRRCAASSRNRGTEPCVRIWRA